MRLLGPYQLVHVKFEISLWRGARVGVRTYLLDGAIDGGEVNGIIRDPKLTNRWLSMKKVIASCDSKYLVIILWAVTEDVELNGSNLVQETTNKIAVIQERLEVSPWRGVVRLKKDKLERVIVSKEFPRGRARLMWIGVFFAVGVVVLLIAPLRGLSGPRGHNMIVLAKVRRDSKRDPEFTWKRKDQMRSKCPQLLVDTANASSLKFSGRDFLQGGICKTHDLIGTDKTKIIRKPSKTGKHQAQDGKSIQRAGSLLQNGQQSTLVKQSKSKS
ncbi:hypothetical protein Tco_0904611, partial [Tanacetum coccineum]